MYWGMAEREGGIMYRLTKRENGLAYYPYCFKEETCEGHGTSSKCDDCNFSTEVCEKLAYYEDLEEQGLLVKLPCKVGEEFWVIAYRDIKIVPAKCTGYTIQVDVVNKINHAYVWIDSVEKESDYWKMLFEEFDIQCFKTKEEAEAKLKELQNE